MTFPSPESVASNVAYNTRELFFHIIAIMFKPTRLLFVQSVIILALSLIGMKLLMLGNFPSQSYLTPKQGLVVMVLGPTIVLLMAHSKIM
jgi:hypothetical protein